MCHDGNWLTLMGGPPKKWCQSWHCDGSLNSTLVFKVFQVSKYAFLSRVYMRGVETIENAVSVFMIGKHWEHTLRKRQPAVQAGNVSIPPLSLNLRDALAGLLNGFSLFSPNIQSQLGRISNRWPSLNKREDSKDAGTAECYCSAGIWDIAEKINEQFAE